MQALEVCDLGLVASLNQRLEAVHHQLARATAQHCLLAEEIGFGLFSEGRLDATGAK